MDWGNVTVEDLIDALREVDWSSPPRPINEFFSRFTLPRSSSRLNSRLKCNFYYYRTNYFIMIIFILGLAFLRRPLAIIAAILTSLAIALLNDREEFQDDDVVLVDETQAVVKARKETEVGPPFLRAFGKKVGSIWG